MYQQKVKEKAVQIIEVIDNTGFFEENGIENKDYAFDKICEKLTEKFIIGELDEGPCFSVSEMDIILKEIIVMNILGKLINDGIVQSYQDDDNEEVFFLTDLGRKVGESLGYDKLENEIDDNKSID